MGLNTIGANTAFAVHYSPSTVASMVQTDDGAEVHHGGHKAQYMTKSSLFIKSCRACTSWGNRRSDMTYRRPTLEHGATMPG